MKYETNYSHANSMARSVYAIYLHARLSGEKQIDGYKVFFHN